MAPDKLFSATISYLKVVTVFGAAMCLVLLFFQSFDPMGPEGLEKMIVRDLYGTEVMPPEARPAFTFMFLLFDLLSVLSLIAQYLVIHYALARREGWAYGYMVLIGVAWPIGAVMIALLLPVHAYLVSAGVMTALFLPPVVILYRYFR